MSLQYKLQRLILGQHFALQLGRPALQTFAIACTSSLQWPEASRSCGNDFFRHENQYNHSNLQPPHLVSFNTSTHVTIRASTWRNQNSVSVTGVHRHVLFLLCLSFSRATALAYSVGLLLYWTSCLVECSFLQWRMHTQDNILLSFACSVAVFPLPPEVLQAFIRHVKCFISFHGVEWESPGAYANMYLHL